MTENPTLLELAFNAPLVAYSVRWPWTLHAVDMGEVIAACVDKRQTVTSVCGKGRLRIVPTVLEGRQTGVPWPPAVQGLKDRGMARCRDCFAATSEKRPRSELAPKGKP